jgi:esterase/lipase
MLFGLTGEQLVQLANIGCAGICVLGVVISGFMIYTLSNDAPPSKPPLIKSFMKYCAIMAVISGISSSVLAWQNAQKVQLAETRTAETEQTARQLLAEVEQSKKTISETQQAFQQMKGQFAALNISAPQREPFIKTLDDRALDLNKLSSELDNAAIQARRSIEK